MAVCGDSFSSNSPLQHTANATPVLEVLFAQNLPLATALRAASRPRLQ